MTETRNKKEFTKSRGKQKTIFNTFVKQKPNKATPTEKVKCPHCKTKILNLDNHQKKCHFNPENIPKTDIDWEGVEEYNLFEDLLFKDPITPLMKRINHTLIPKGNPLADYTDELVTYMKSLPKGKREKLLHQKLHQDLSRGIELRLLNEDEFVDRIKDKKIVKQCRNSLRTNPRK